MDYLSIAREAIELESSALLDSIHNLSNEMLENIIESIVDSKGKLVVCGVGKSGLIGAKISATLSSTGTPSVFLHPTEALHGDLGMLQANDILLAISYSGESEELLSVIPHIKRLGIKIITMSKSAESSLSKMGDFFLDISVKKEACPLNIAPTSSTTLTLVLGDVLAICLMKRRSFSAKDFASFHPGGSLGKQLFVKLKDLMQVENLPIIESNMSIKQCIPLMSEARLGNALIVENDKLVAVLSDGDLRRALLREDFNMNDCVMKYASSNPKVCEDENLLAYDALKMIEKNKIQILVITDESRHIKGVVHLHALISAGIKSD